MQALEGKKQAAVNTMLLITALLWGSGFAFRKMALVSVTPFYFNFLRFVLGFLFVFTIYLFVRMKHIRKPEQQKPAVEFKPRSYQILGGFLAGSMLAFASALQQWGMLTTTAGKTGFITSLYTIFVPLLGLIFLKRKVLPQVWIGVCCAVLGLFLISGSLGTGFVIGDISVFIAAIFIAIQILVIGHFGPYSDGLFLSAVQLFFSTVWSLILALLFESGNTWAGVTAAAGPILYAGIFAIGLAYTLQIFAQKKAVPAVAAVLFSMESVFGALFGALLLGERMELIQLLGCLLIFFAVLIAQYEREKETPTE